jgi:hypothetical protein
MRPLGMRAGKAEAGQAGRPEGRRGAVRCGSQPPRSLSGPHRAVSWPGHKPGRRWRAARLTCAPISGISSISTSRSAFARTSSRIGDVAVTVARRA